MVTTYRLARQTARWCRFAVVTVEVSPAPQHSVSVAGKVGDPRHRAEIELGAWRALRYLAPDSQCRVTVTNALATDVDTGIGDLHEATARAVWQALDVTPRPAYTGFSELDLVARWLRDRIGLRVVAVTEARHWYNDRRGDDASSLLHAWLHFEERPPVRLHGCGDEFLLSAGEPYPPYGMAGSGTVRVGPATSPDLMARLVGARLTNAAVLSNRGLDPRCAGLLLRVDGTDNFVIGTLGDKWILGTQQIPMEAAQSWTFQGWVGQG
ncbi:MAG TPA: hypothetical protein VFX61_23615 [Micromonosporaceae bacterium]|nr:hypothetical protein [Micromonosporaceae bacterium]